MLKPDASGAFIAHVYGWAPAAVELVHADLETGRALWRAEDAAGMPWMLRLRRGSAPVEEWFGGLGAADWLAERAAVLLWLAERGVSSPHVALTRAGTPVGTHAGWSGLLTSFIPGQRLAGGEYLGRLAAALGDLHAATAGGPTSAGSWWHPLDLAVAETRRWLGPAADVPPRWRDLQADCLAALETFAALERLPLACIHGDCWLGNAVNDESGAVRLIDWDAAGRGVALLDLGALLGDCFSGAADTTRPEPAWIAAVIDGYAEQRRLGAAEVAALPAAIRFGAVFRSGVRFAIGRQGGWGDGVERGLAREQARLLCSAAIAELALSHLSFRSGASASAG